MGYKFQLFKDYETNESMKIIFIILNNIFQLCKIINLKYLKYLTLDVKYFHRIEISSIILKELSKILPSSLYYLDLYLVINPNDLQVAFESCKQIKLKKLLIRNNSENNLDTTLSIIKDFVKEKNLEFLSYGIGNSLRDGNNQILEELVKEIQSFVKMVRYDDLVICVSNIDGNLIMD